ncbi:hypothetical protein ABID22_000562 [Pontibacter aydingkolensis]|uniref:T9SS type A sorting domain-containing protein n=1 Tax=Pontibacter aydingkolensis TaxID=1911536 RepID=A0ABS7CST8_9BACT|nr:T9SS type A sorting domain-containing protein [Pontibacter aydingkolensis]
MIYYEPFATAAFPKDWIQYSSNSTKWEVIQGPNSRGGSNQGSYLRLERKAPGEETGLNIWTFSAPLKLTAGRIYTISFYQKNQGGGAVGFQVLLNTAQHHTSTTGSQSVISTVLLPKSKFGGIESTELVSVPVTGTYYLGFGVTSFTDRAELAIDDIRITEATGALTGVYTVGEDGDFVKPETAAAHLNKRGISGPVTFNFADEDYMIDNGNSSANWNINIKINPFPAMGTAPVIFKSSVPGVPAVITGSSDHGPLFHLNGVNNVHLNGLTINNNNSKTPVAISIDESSNCSINACTAITSAQLGNTGARGISIKNGSNNTLSNNMVHSIIANGRSLTGEDSDFSSSIYGIVVDGGTNHKLYNNSVAMTGQRSTLSSMAAALAIGATTTGLDLRNNIFSNTQSSTATGSTNYAIYSLAGNAAFSHINYNLYFAASSMINHLGYMSGNGSATRLSDWKTVTLKDASSMYGQPAFKNTTTSANAPIDLSIDPANPRSWFTNGTGVQLPSVSTDMRGAARSTTRATGGVDLGALEFTPTATAPNMVVSGALVPAPGQRQVFSFAEREMAVITWSPSSVSIPTGFALKYRPGQFINSSYLGQHMNSSMEVVNATGTYAYDIEMHYDEALLGTLVEDAFNFTFNESTPALGWVSHALTDVEYDFNANKLIKKGISSGSAFVGADRSYSLVFYNKAGDADLTLLTSWAVFPNGTGISPTTFSNVGRSYFITNYSPNAILKLSKDLIITGTNTKVILGNGSTPVTLPVYDKKSILGSQVDLTASSVLLIDAPVWPNIGTMDPKSTIMLGPNSPLDVPVSRDLFNVVVFGGKKIKLSKNLVIKAKLELRAGSKVELGDYDLNIDYDGQVVSNDFSSYIIPNGKGKLKQGIRAGQEVSLPVGTATTYNPVKIKLAEGAQEDIFSVGLIDGVYGAYDANDVPTGAALTTHNINKTWFVSEAVKGGSNITLTLTWAQDEAQTSFDAAKCYVQHYENSTWDEYSVGEASTTTLTAADGTTKTYYSISRPGITSFSPMGVRTSDRINPLPVELVQFKASVTNENSVRLNWTTASEKDNDYFVIERSADGKHFSEVSRVTGSGTTSLRTSYTYTDNNPLTGASYYRLRQVDYDGTFEFSAMRSVTVKAVQGLILSVYPNPSQGSEVNLLIQGMPQGAQATLQVTDLAGKTIFHQSVKETRTILPTSNLQPGIYVISLVSSLGKQTQKLVVQ